MRCETAVAILASEGLALVSVSRQLRRDLSTTSLFFFSLSFSFFCVCACVCVSCMYVRAYLAIPCVSTDDNVKHTKSNIRYDIK